MSDLEHMEIGMVFDMLTEKSNDDWDGWKQLATQDDFNRF